MTRDGFPNDGLPEVMIPLYFGTFDRVEKGVHIPSRKGSVK